MARHRPVHVYAGVNRVQGGPLGGVFRLIPGEDRWEQLGNGIPKNGHVHMVVVHPRDPDLVFAATDDGPYRSLDAGNSWARTDFPERNLNVWSILVHPTDPNIVYAGTAPIGLWRSEDGGETWRAMPKPAVPERFKISFDHRVMKLAVNPRLPDEIFAALEVNGVMRSRDRGESWEDCNPGLIKLSDRPHLQNHALCDAPYEGMLDGHAICASAAAPGSVIFAGRMGLFRSDDEGGHWQDMELGRQAHLPYSRDILVSPHDPRTLFVGVGVSVKNDAGAIYRSDDLGRNWKRFDHSLAVDSSVMRVAVDQIDPNHVYGAVRYGSVIGTQDGGKTWSDYPLPKGCTGVFSVACG